MITHSRSASNMGTARGMTLIEVIVAASVFSVAMVIAMQATLMMNKSAASGIQYSALSRTASIALARIAEELGPAKFSSVVLYDNFKYTPPEETGESAYCTVMTFKKVVVDPGSKGAVNDTKSQKDYALRWILAERGDSGYGKAKKADYELGVDENHNGITDEGYVVLEVPVDRNDNGVYTDAGDGEIIDADADGIVDDDADSTGDKPGVRILIADHVPEGGFQIRQTGNGLDITLKLYYLVNEGGEMQAKIGTFNTTVTLSNN